MSHLTSPTQVRWDKTPRKANDYSPRFKGWWARRDYPQYAKTRGYVSKSPHPFPMPTYAEQRKVSHPRQEMERCGLKI